MARTPKLLESLLAVPRVREAAEALVAAVGETLAEAALSERQYARALGELERRRGRPLPLPALLAGTGQGARVRLADGRELIDFATGIGVYGFGHGDPDLLAIAAVAAAGDTVFQGHLTPGPEYLRLSRALLRQAGPRLRHAWLSVSGAMANENALKMVLQKHAPADRVIAFEGGFAGRTLALAELSDNPGYRQGLPLSGRCLTLPFHREDDPDSSARSLAALDAHLARYPGRVAAMIFELVQGEGGVRPAPASFFRALMERCREAGIAVWVDEVQTFARTGELFAFQTLGLGDLVDLVTVGKLLQGSAVLLTGAYNPKPGLVAGTYAGSTVGMAVGARILERLESEGYLGPEGRVALLGRRIERRHDALRKRLPRAVGTLRGMGALQAFPVFDGSAAHTRAVLRAAFDEGLLVWSAGSDPTVLRMLPPLNTTDEELEAAFGALERALQRVARDERLPC